MFSTFLECSQMSGVFYHNVIHGLGFSFTRKTIKHTFSMFYTLILIAKYYIYSCKLKKVYPSLRVSKAKIRAVYQVEKKIATRRNKLTKHYGKWERFLPHFSSDVI